MTQRKIVIHVGRDASTPNDIRTGIKMAADQLRSIPFSSAKDADAALTSLRRARNDIEGLIVSIKAFL